MIGPAVAEPQLTESPATEHSAAEHSAAEQARAPVPRHHRRDSRMVAGLAGLAALTLVMMVGGAIVESQLTTDERFREFVVTGEPGEPITTTTFTAVVVGVRPAAVIADDDGGLHDTGGVWLLVRVRAYGIDEPAAIEYAAVRDSRERTWLATGRFEQPLTVGGFRVQPGIPVEFEIAFEVPRETVADLRLRLAFSPVDLRMETVAEVPLPVEEPAVAEALAQPEPAPMELAEPEVVIADPQVLRDAGEPSR